MRHAALAFAVAQDAAGDARVCNKGDDAHVAAAGAEQRVDFCPRWLNLSAISCTSPKNDRLHQQDLLRQIRRMCEIAPDPRKPLRSRGWRIWIGYRSPILGPLRDRFFRPGFQMDAIRAK
jgi:hypothetical protein